MNTVQQANTSHGLPQSSRRGRYFWVFTVLLLVFLTALPTWAQEQPVDLKGAVPTVITDEMLTEIDAHFVDALARYGIPGATLAIVQNGKVIHSNGFGVRELGKTATVTPDTLFMIGSVPKSMTSLMIGTVIDEGKLTWDTPVVDILPSFTMANPESSRSVTFRDLLSMRSGLPNFDISLFIERYSPQQIIESLKTIPLIGKPGEQYAYSNQGFASAGFIATIAAGADYNDDLYASYAKLMQDRVFDPIGMAHTTFDFEAGASKANVASPHSIDLAHGGFTTFPIELEHGGFSIIPAGGTTWSTSEDLAKYLITQMNHGVSADGDRVVSEARLLDTWKPGISTPFNTDYALGWVIKPDYHGLQQIEYGGGNIGYTSLISFLPEANLGVVVLTGRIAGDAFTHAMTQYVYETAFGLEHTADADSFAEEQGFQGMAAQMSGGVEAQPDPAAVADYLGKYEHDSSVHFNEGGELVLSAAFGDFPLYGIPEQKGAFLVGLAFGMTVQFAEDGKSFTIATGDSQPPITIHKVG